MKLIGICLLAFILSVFLFPTLHRVHDYYNLENGVFLLFAVAAALSMLPARQRYILTAAIVAGQLCQFVLVYGPTLRADNGLREWGAEIAAHTKPNDVLLIFGMEWSPVLSYYSQRKAVMCTTLAPVEVCEQVAKTARIGMVIGTRPIK